jgi:very-short-patch-repair endonuclease
MRSMVEGPLMTDPRQLRRNMSPAERRLWNHLRTRPGELKFRRQHPIGPYRLDFFCHAAGVAIEVDGASYDMGNRPARDERRDTWVGTQGIKTLRFVATDIRDHLEAVITQILEECAARPPPTGSAGPPPPEIRGRRK